MVKKVVEFILNKSYFICLLVLLIAALFSNNVASLPYWKLTTLLLLVVKSIEAGQEPAKNFKVKK